METSSISRREILKGTGALIVSFNFFGALPQILAQSARSDHRRASGDVARFLAGGRPGWRRHGIHQQGRSWYRHWDRARTNRRGRTRRANLQNYNGYWRHR